MSPTKKDQMEMESESIVIKARDDGRLAVTKLVESNGQWTTPISGEKVIAHPGPSGALV
jgi:hypothetical protein